MLWELTGEGEGVTGGRGGHKIGLREGQEPERKGWGPWERYREGGPPDLLGEQRKQRTQRREELAWPGRVELGGPW